MVAGVVALGVLTACTTRAEITRPRGTIVVQTPDVRPTAVSPPTSPPPRPSPIRLAGCHPRTDTIAVRDPSAATTARVTRAWRRIDAWLDAHAPRSARSLRNPAPDASIARLQTRLGRPLPPDLVTSLRVHDGADATTAAAFTFPPFHVPMSARDVGREWRMMCGVVEDLGTQNPGDWKPAFTPFAQAGDGGELYADHTGQVGEYFAEDGTHTDGYPASYAAFLETTATLLETGRPGPSGFRAHPHDGVLDWKP